MHQRHQYTPSTHHYHTQCAPSTPGSASIHHHTHHRQTPHATPQPHIICTRTKDTAVHCSMTISNTYKPCTTLRRTATPCTTLHLAAPRCTTQHRTAPHNTTLHHTAPPCTTLHHTATYCHRLQESARGPAILKAHNNSGNVSARGRFGRQLTLQFV